MKRWNLCYTSQFLFIIINLLLEPISGASLTLYCLFFNFDITFFYCCLFILCIWNMFPLCPTQKDLLIFYRMRTSWAKPVALHLWWIMSVFLKSLGFGPGCNGVCWLWVYCQRLRPFQGSNEEDGYWRYGSGNGGSMVSCLLFFYTIWNFMFIVNFFLIC